ncbi:hypothetical protein LRS73_07580 [Methylobacterium currus]|uniref:hypothetical protein n=1 Tax=Methylobacterium currus TaxID=2051553 RepID=UPI001E534BB8|nr:hypothetical protein [Methylobacterium currus]UHC17722.1 hypothetical protein LRS73_07580 [Methylobacterium currus]
MSKTIIVLASSLIAFSSAVPGAQARGRGEAFAAGLVGGLAVGALAGAAARAEPVYGEGYDYAPEYDPPHCERVYHRPLVMREYEEPFWEPHPYDPWHD